MVFAVRVRHQRVAGDLTFTARRATSVEEVNKACSSGAGALQGILAYNERRSVSMDFNHDAHSAVFDATLTKVIEAPGQGVAWYDNEWDSPTA